MPLKDDCGFTAFTSCTRYRGLDGTMLLVSRPRRLVGGTGVAPERITLRDRSRTISRQADSRGDFVPLTFPQAQHVLLFHASEMSADQWVDGMPLSEFDFIYGERPLGVRVQGARSWAALSPDGTSFVTTTGGSREAYRRKTLVRCNLLTARCGAWHHRRGFVEFDPWSPDGRRVAFIRAAEVGEVQTMRNRGTMAEPWAEGRR